MRNKNKQIGLVILLLSAMLFTVPLKAQVTIGAQTAPDNYSLLDLVTTNVKKGVHLPRLNTAERDALIPATTTDSAAAVGVAVYNTTTNCYDVWNGKKWLSLCDYTNNAPVIMVQPRAFSWKELTTDAKFTGVTSPTDPTPLDTATISVTATGATSYQWYELSRTGQATVAAGTSNAATYTPNGTKLGMKQYYCLVSNAFGSTKSDIAKVAVGCGAMSMDGSWRTFMCYNLGATETTIAGQLSYIGNLYFNGFNGPVPATGYSGAAADAAVYGDLYQWGRIPDGHQLRSSLNSATTNAPSAGPYTAIDTPWPDGSEQIASGAPDYGKFVVNNSPSTGSGAYAPFDWNANPTGHNYDLWRPFRYIPNDPCVHVTGVDGGDNFWRVPTQGEWGDIWRGGLSSSNSSTATTVNTANTWVWQAAGTSTNNTTGTAAGYLIKPDGVTTTLFLPFAGYRHASVNGQLLNQGVLGMYWSSISFGNFIVYLQLRSYNITFRNSNSANGFSVRCVAEL